jgi:hypothetical protein
MNNKSSALPLFIFLIISYHTKLIFDNNNNNNYNTNLIVNDFLPMVWK